MRAPFEPRSFNPPPGRTTPVKFTPVSETKPTLRALARGQNKLHLCLEDHRENTETVLGEHTQKLDDQGAAIAEIKSALRIGEKGQTLATMRPATALLQQAAAIAGGGGALIFVYKVLVAAWPSIWAFLVALNHAVLTTV